MLYHRYELVGAVYVDDVGLEIYLFGEVHGLFVNGWVAKLVHRRSLQMYNQDSLRA